MQLQLAPLVGARTGADDSLEGLGEAPDGGRGGQRQDGGVAAPQGRVQLRARLAGGQVLCV